MKRWIATVLCLLLLIGCLPAVSAATVVDVSDKAGFAAIGSDLAGSYRLTKDIIFTAEDFAEGGVMHGKLPFAAGSTFSGTLDGNGYTVAGLMIDVAYRLDDTVAPRQESGVNSAALFYDLSGSVKNLELKNVALNFTADVKSVFSELRVGAIAGTMQASAIIDQCAVSGAIVVRHNGNGRLNVGGLAGFCQGDVTNSACYVDISANRNYDAWLRVGGLVGQLDTAAAQLSKCYANTVITTVNSAGTDNCRQGALTGRNNGSVENCYFAGTEDAVTGDAGANATVTETDNLNTADLSLTDSYKWLDFTNLWSIQTVNGVRQAGLQAFVCEHTTPGPWTEVSAPSCFAVGKEVQRCALCGDVMNQRDIPATGEHVWATTLTQGETTHYYACTTDGCTARNEENEHTAGEVIEDEKPGCTSDGKGHKDCTVCGKLMEKDVVIPSTGEHAAADELVVDTAPSCYATGIGHSVCKDCGITMDEDIVIPATGEHVWAATLTQGDTTHYYACTNDGCTAKKDEGAHTPGEIIEDTAPTCGAGGIGHKDCTVCGKTVAENVTISATGNHNWDNGVVTTEPAIGKEGVKTYTCATCGNTKTEKIPAAGVNVLTIFKDLKKGDWYVKNGAIDYVYNNGLFSGTSATTFGPNDPMTRAMFVTVLGRLDGQKVNNKVTTVFTDVKKNRYYTGYVKWANDNGIVAGLSKTIFGPDENITREQICAMMVRYCDYAKIELQKLNAAITFKDAAKISKYARPAVKACQMGGLVNGEKTTGGYNFRPQGNASRAEVATIIMNFAKTYK